MLEEEAAGGTSGPCGGQPGTCSMDAASHWSWPCLIAPGTCVVELCEACGGDLLGVWDTCSLSPCSPCSVPARQLGALGPWSSGWWPVRQHTKVSASSQTWRCQLLGCFFKKKPQPIVPLGTAVAALCHPVSAALAELGLPVPPSGLCTPRAGKSLSLAGALLPRVRAGRAPPTLRGVQDQRCPGRAGKRPGNAAPSPAAGCACWGAPACAEGFVRAFHPCELHE